MKTVYDWWPRWPAYVVTDNGERFLYLRGNELLAELIRAMESRVSGHQNELLKYYFLPEAGQRAN